MEIGIFERVFVRPTLEARLDAVRDAELSTVQFDFVSAGLAHMPDQIQPEDARRIRDALAARDIGMAAVSGTFNIIDPQHQRDGLRRLGVLAAACSALGTRVITLSTGTRHSTNMWAHHPDNRTPEAWNDMMRAMGEIARIGEEHRVVMAFEPEVNNVVDSARSARRLLDELASPWVGVVMDGANIFRAGELPHMRAVLDEAFDLLGEHIVLAHGKDLDHDGDAGHLPAGHGVLDYGHYLRLLAQSPYRGPLIMHGLQEQHVAGCVAFLRNAGGGV
jgi:sugar phosphate isomerase/epimerase